MSITFFGLLGFIGIVLLLLSYFMLIVGQLKVIDIHYIVMNLLGAFLLVFTLVNGGTVPVFQTLVAWLFISLYGFYKHHITTTT